MYIFLYIYIYIYITFVNCPLSLWADNHIPDGYINVSFLPRSDFVLKVDPLSNRAIRS